MTDEPSSDESAPGTWTETARERWQRDRTTFQRVYDVLNRTPEYTSASEIAERAVCSPDGARDALAQLVEMRIAERRGERPVEYRRNESYFRWKRAEALASKRAVDDLRDELDDLLREDRSLQERFDVPNPGAVQPERFEGVDHAGIQERIDALKRWRSLREEIEILQRAIYRARRDADGSASA